MSIREPISRRNFLKLGIATSSAILSGGISPFKPISSALAVQEDKILHGVCDVCSMGCAYLTYMRAGRVVRLRGNPKDQVAEGKLCVRGYSGIRLLYDPDRLKFPMKRTDPKKGIGEDSKWVKISWEEALNIVAAKFKEIREKDGPQAIMIVSRPQTWQKHFAKALAHPIIFPIITPATVRTK